MSVEFETSGFPVHGVSQNTGAGAGRAGSFGG
jgi:hypothetical protein